MDIIGLDLHKRETQRSLKAADGTSTERRIVTSRERVAAVLGNRPRARILLEASTARAWVARWASAPVSASAVVATVDDITRFPSAHQLQGYFGAVPSEQSSGEKRRLGPSTKAGNRRVRWLLVEAAWRILQSRSPETAALRAWTLTIAPRRGKRIAVVALARRLAGLLYAL